MIEEEIWKTIPGYENYYCVSNKGKLKSLERCIIRSNGIKKLIKEKILVNWINNRGYIAHTLTKDGTHKKQALHISMAMAFLNHIPNGYKVVIDHIDDNKLNNNLNNLRLVSARENVSKNRKNKYSKFTGVCYIKNNIHNRKNRWTSYIQINGKNKYLGNFYTELEASEAYKKALLELEKINN